MQKQMDHLQMDGSLLVTDGIILKKIMQSIRT